MKIVPASARATRPGPPTWMTGVAWLDEIAGPDDAPGAARMVLVTFSPGARTHWHTHPHGQILHVVAGAGRVQTWGEPARAIIAGDTILIPAGEKHWHGASAEHLMSHLAVQEADPEGQTTHWLEPVSDSDYIA